MAQITKEKLAELLARARAAAPNQPKPVPIPEPLLTQSIQALPLDPMEAQINQVFLDMGLEPNPEQMAFIKFAVTGKDCILIGPAGTGKTTTQGVMAHCLRALGKLPPLRESTKWLIAGNPGVVITAFTNKAVNNIRWKMPKDLQASCITTHKLLEFQPVWYEVEDPVTKLVKNTMRFEPARNAANPLPASLRIIIIEEASMMGTDLYGMLMAACPHKPQIIMLGDLYQLPPIYESAILGFKLTEWPVIELKNIYRQAADNPIISFAWRIKNGEELSSTAIIDPVTKRVTIPAFTALYVPDKLLVKQWQKKLGDTEALLTAIKFFTTLADANEYDPSEDIILMPFNKGFGTIELNNGISQHLGAKRGAIVNEVIAGFRKHYLAIGDKVLYEKEDHIIEDITKNADYTGKQPQLASKTLDRWGHEHERVIIDRNTGDGIGIMSDEAIESFMEGVLDTSEDKVNLASHTIQLRRLADEQEIEIDSAGDINNILGGYAITIHKAQGSEWRRVFCVFHHTHAVMLNRELLYTAVTRARESLYVICEPNTFEKGIRAQKIKGTTLAEKAEFFKGKIKEKEVMAELELRMQKNAAIEVGKKVAESIDTYQRRQKGDWS